MKQIAKKDIESLVPLLSMQSRVRVHLVVYEKTQFGICLWCGAKHKQVLKVVHRANCFIVKEMTAKDKLRELMVRVGLK